MEQVEPSDVQARDEATSRSFGLGYLTGKLSEAYRDARSFHFQNLSQKFSGVYEDASRRLQGTREVIQNVGVADVKVVFLHYASKVTKELPLLHRLEPKHPAEPPDQLGLDGAQPEAKGHAPGVPQGFTALDLPGVSTWPEGSVWCVREERPEVFCQKLVQLPPALPQVTSLTSQELLQQLQWRVPQLSLGQPLGIFWLKTASRRVPLQKPGFLLLSEKEVLVLSPEGPSDALSVERFDLGGLREVQVGLAGQLLRLLGCSDEAVLAVFTYSKELTQEFLRVLLRALCPDALPEGVRGHPLLSGDLMLLSLDWRSHTPDLVLDSGLRLTSRFKRVLADLLYVVHGNMDGPDKPSLADTRPLLYTSVKLLPSARLPPDDMCQLLLTETHVALLRQDGVFPPAARGSAPAPVPVRPQFRALQLRRRSHVGCVFVKQSDSWLVVDITFTPADRRRGPRRSSVEAWPASRRHGDSWQLCVGCTSAALALINHLCVPQRPGAGSPAGAF